MILQFGTGNFLRAFADLFIDQLDRDPGTAAGPVVAVQSTGRERAEAINRAAARGGYHVAIQGFRGGEVVDETERVACLSRALAAATEWPEVLSLGRDPGLTMILSNTTEAGLALDPADASRPAPGAAPRSFPAKLLAVLAERREAGLPGPWIAPCELIESNGTRLRSLVLEQAARWDLEPGVSDWLEGDCRWVSTLVDRIVPGPPRRHPLLGQDPLLLSAEPFASWAVAVEGREAFPLRHPVIVETRDLAPYALRKVRLLNGAHSALVAKGRSLGVETVGECVGHPEIGPWLEELLFGEIVPVLEGRCEDPAGFAREVLDRFRNPFLEHRLSAIALHHEAKIAVRLRPTREEFRERFGKAPARLSEILP